jgi:uncharacterized protein (TIGR03083 family)
MDRLPHFRREIRDFTAAARAVEHADTVPELPACPGWSMTNVVMHLGWVHRYVTHIISNRLLDEPVITDLEFLHLPAERAGWPTDPEGGPYLGPMPTGLLDWFTDGADTLTEIFATTDASIRVSTWSAEQSVGFWLRMQMIEAAIHRWDAHTGLGAPAPIEPELAVDLIEQYFAVMVPARRGWGQAPEGRGEMFRFRATDVERAWTVRFDGGTVAVTDEPAPDEFAGSAGDLALFLWHRIGLASGTLTGDPAAADTWLTLAPPR